MIMEIHAWQSCYLCNLDFPTQMQAQSSLSSCRVVHVRLVTPAVPWQSLGQPGVTGARGWLAKPQSDPPGPSARGATGVVNYRTAWTMQMHLPQRSVCFDIPCGVHEYVLP